MGIGHGRHHFVQKSGFFCWRDEVGNVVGRGWKSGDLSFLESGGEGGLMVVGDCRHHGEREELCAGELQYFLESHLFLFNSLLKN